MAEIYKTSTRFNIIIVSHIYRKCQQTCVRIFDFVEPRTKDTAGSKTF